MPLCGHCNKGQLAYLKRKNTRDYYCMSCLIPYFEEQAYYCDEFVGPIHPLDEIEIPLEIWHAILNHIEDGILLVKCKRVCKVFYKYITQTPVLSTRIEEELECMKDFYTIGRCLTSSIVKEKRWDVYDRSSKTEMENFVMKNRNYHGFLVHHKGRPRSSKFFLSEYLVGRFNDEVTRHKWFNGSLTIKVVSE